MNNTKIRVLYLLKIAKNRELNLMLISTINRICIQLFIDAFNQKDQLREEEKRKKQNNLLYTVNSLIELALSLNKLV
jgi:hypothetical protein